MRNVILTNDQMKKINQKHVGITPGKKDKVTGIRATIHFCSALEFSKTFGLDIEKIFIEI